jgi:Cft2 family RNA processing exonuclease
MLEWAGDLKILGTELFLDSRSPRSLCFMSHAHSDHLGRHERPLATPATAVLAEYRLRTAGTHVLPFGCPWSLDGDTVLTPHPAGHVLGSAMLHVRRPEGTLLYTGDFKLRPSLTVPPAEPVHADVLVMESTYGNPRYRFPPWRQTADQLVELAALALRDGRQPIVMGYSLGKAQEIVRVLTDAGLPVTCHGAVTAMNGLHARLGVDVGPTRPYAAADFHGKRALDLAERGVLVAPPQVARSAFVTRFDNPCRIMMSGWALSPGAQYRYRVDHVLPLSDHADFDELLELIDRVRPSRIYTQHGFADFPEHLRHRGLRAELAKPDPQLSLFE